MFTVELKGFEAVKQMFAEIGKELLAAQVRSVLDSAGQIIAKEAKSEVELRGELGQLLKNDIGVYRDNKSGKNAEYVLIGPRFKRYTLRNQAGQKIGLIAQHMTIGFNQTERETRSGDRRGRVRLQYQNPIKGAMYIKRNEVSGAIEKGVNKQLNKVKSKYPDLVK